MKSLSLSCLTLIFLLFQLHSLAYGGRLGHHTATQTQCSLPKDEGSTLRVIHVSSPCSPLKPKTSVSWEENVIQMLAQDQARVNYLSSLVSAKKSVAPVAWGRQIMQTPTYLVRVNVGTPAQTFLMALDTSSDAAWLPCSGCLGCPGTSLFASDRSVSFKGVACAALQCHQATGTSVPPQGLLGLGRGQLRLGPIAQPQKMKFTPLLKNPRRSSLYYVNLIAIKVGRKTVDIPPSALAFDSTTGAGTVIDSGTVYTRLVEPAYNAVRDEFRRRMGKATVTSLGGFDTCYTVPIKIPSLTFMFQGMNMTMAQDNFLLHSTSSSITCLAIAAAPDNVNSVLNVIANMQQQNHRVLFDVPNSRVGIAREPCS
ncbi:hypothetical protein KSS87_005256 [Heliosperma pusillum]|nr:hypothetical protein KSS87_005256 [Heliosperma pusillum]